jgi:hypothetical protein
MYIKDTIRISVAVAVLLIAGGMYAQVPTPTPSFSLHVDVAPTSARADSELLIVVDLTNNRPEEMVMLVELGIAVQDNFAIHVRDSRGNSVSGPKRLPYDEVANVGILPGETMKFQGDLSRMFDLSRPDRYEIQVERQDAYTNKAVKSNVCYATVTSR